MKQKRDEIKALLLATAREEFLEKGFRPASLRHIARKAGYTTGVIYTYFRNKDEIFATLVSPVILAFEKRLAEPERPAEQAMAETGPKSWFTRNLQFLIDLVEARPDEMNLLFLKAEGSSYQDYKEFLIQKGTERSVAIFRTLDRSPEFRGQALSRFFVHNLVKYVINVVVEILKQEKRGADIQAYEKEITAFLFSGWKALVKV